MSVISIETRKANQVAAITDIYGTRWYRFEENHI